MSLDLLDFKEKDINYHRQVTRVWFMQEMHQITPVGGPRFKEKKPLLYIKRCQCKLSFSMKI